MATRKRIPRTSTSTIETRLPIGSTGNFKQRQRSEGGRDEAQCNLKRYRRGRWTADEWKLVFVGERGSTNASFRYLRTTLWSWSLATLSLTRRRRMTTTI